MSDYLIAQIFVLILWGLLIWSVYLLTLVRKELDSISKRIEKLDGISNTVDQIKEVAGDNKDAAMVATITKNVALIVTIETIRSAIPKGHEINDADIVAIFQHSFDESIRKYIARSVTEAQIESTTTGGNDE